MVESRCSFLNWISVCLFFALTVFVCHRSEVEGKSNDVIRSGWFNSVEGFEVRNIKDNNGESQKVIDSNTDDNENTRTRRPRRKRKRIAKKIRSKMQQEIPVIKPSGDFEILEVKKRKKNRKDKRHFVKTDEEKNVDSNMSASPEKVKKRKPVDIIVHIKMNE